MEKRIKIFCCSAFEDTQLLMKLRLHLSPLVQSYPISITDSTAVGKRKLTGWMSGNSLLIS
jgi:hypothetical protein